MIFARVVAFGGVLTAFSDEYLWPVSGEVVRLALEERKMLGQAQAHSRTEVKHYGGTKLP